MNDIVYIKLNEANPKEFIPLLNANKTREHLIEHELFDENTVRDWLESKIKIDSSPGCKVRAIVIDKQLAGWCGVQLEDSKYEIAIVIGENFWGSGRQIFSDIMHWAKALGHKTVYIHFLHTRPQYKFLHKISRHAYESELLGNKFTTYELTVD